MLIFRTVKTYLIYCRRFTSLIWKMADLKLSMDQLKDDFDPARIQVALPCDGNRRKGLNTIERSKGFNLGSGAVSCAYWKGPPLQDVLLAAGIPKNMSEGHRY